MVKRKLDCPVKNITAGVAALKRQEWRARQAVHRGTNEKKPAADKATAAVQGRLIRNDWKPGEELALQRPPRRAAQSSMPSTDEDLLAQCKPAELAKFLAWLRTAPGHVRALETHPSNAMLAAKLQLIRGAPWQLSLLAVLAYFFLTDREAGLQVVEWLLACGPKPQGKKPPSWGELRLLLGAAQGPGEKPAQPDGLGHRALRIGVLPGRGTLSLPYQRLAQIRAWSYHLVERPMESLPLAWDSCCSTTLAACLCQLPNCGPYLAARVLSWLCMAGQVGFTGGCLGPGAVTSLRHLWLGEEQQMKTCGEWPWTGPQLHKLTRQLAAAAGISYWDTQAALCLWTQLGFGKKLQEPSHNNPGSASSTAAARSPLPKVPAGSCKLPLTPRARERQQQPEGQLQQQDEQVQQQHRQQNAASKPAAAETLVKQLSGVAEAPCAGQTAAASSSSTRSCKPDAAPVMGSGVHHAKEGGQRSSERAMVAEPALTRAAHLELESWMAGMRSDLVPVAVLMTRALGFQHAAAFRALVELYASRFLLARADRGPGPARCPQLTAAVMSLALKAVGQQSAPAHGQLFHLVWASSGVPASARAVAEFEVRRALDFAGPRLLLPSV